MLAGHALIQASRSNTHITQTQTSAPSCEMRIQKTCMHMSTHTCTHTGHLDHTHIHTHTHTHTHTPTHTHTHTQYSTEDASAVIHLVGFSSFCLFSFLFSFQAFEPLSSQ